MIEDLQNKILLKSAASSTTPNSKSLPVLAEVIWEMSG